METGADWANARAVARGMSARRRTMRIGSMSLLLGGDASGGVECEIVAEDGEGSWLLHEERQLSGDEE